MPAMAAPDRLSADSSSPSCGSAWCTSADHKAAVLASLCEHAIPARDYLNPPLHLHPILRGEPGARRVDCSAYHGEYLLAIVSLVVHDSMAYDAASVVAAVQEGGS
jgi:hypothetical protein